MHVLVIGGGGRTGRRIVEQLNRRGDAAAVLSRHAGAAPTTVVRHYAGAITDLDTVARAAADADGVVVSVESSPNGDGPDGPLAVHQDGIRVVIDAAPLDAHIVLISQIYITRPEALPSAGEAIVARGRGEQLLRATDRAYTILRPSWLTDTPGGGGLRVAQGDTGEGSVSRTDVAATTVAALHAPTARGVTCELYSENGPPPDLATVFAHLTKDAR